MHHSRLTVLTAPVALRKGAGRELGLLKAQDFEKMVSLVLEEEGGESFQMPSPTSKPLLLLRARHSFALGSLRTTSLCQCCGQCPQKDVLASPFLCWA